jgi:hypothetical protein
MRKIRLFLIALAVPAGILFTMREIGGSPISKGYDTGFEWRSEPSMGRLVLLADLEGNMNCRIKLKIPATDTDFRSETSNKIRLKVVQESLEQDYQWISINKDSPLSEEKFEWPSGSHINLDVEPKGQPAALSVVDWYVYSSTKSADSSHLAHRRSVIFWISLSLLLLSCAGGIAEAIEKYHEKREPFSPQRCIELLIGAVDGADGKETKRMRASLEKVLVEGSSVQEALAPFKLGQLEGQLFWLRTTARFRVKLDYFIAELNRHRNRL